MANRSRSKKPRRARSPAPTGDADRDALPRPVRIILEGAERWEKFLDPAKSIEEITADVQAEVRSLAQRIVDLAGPYDAFDLLANVHLRVVFNNPETYKETEHEGSATAVEVVAICLAARGQRNGTSPVAARVRQRPDVVIDEIAAAAHEILSTGSMLGVLRAFEAPDVGLASMGLGSILREIFVRNPAYPHMEADTVAALMTDPAIDADCRAALGCGGSDIQAVFDAHMALYSDGWNQRFETLADLMNLASEQMQAAKAASTRTGGGIVIDEEVRAKATKLFDEAWDNPGDTATYSDAELAARAGVSEAAVAQVHSLTSLDFHARDPGDAVIEFLRGDNPLRLRPLLRDAMGATMPVHSGLLTPQVRPIVEALLKAAGKWDRYQKHRGRVLEDRAVALLTSIVPTATVHQGYEYFVPDPTAATAQTEPKSYTRRVEGDALIVVDDIAIVVEAKAGSFSAGSRQGDPKHLAGDLRKIVTAAAEQANRTRDRILGDGGLRLGDGTWLDLSAIREVHTIAVSLDDLSGIATVSADLVAAGLLSSDPLPWTVSLHDLRVVAEVIDRPAELILYLRRRTDPEATMLFHAVDELDLFLHFLDGQLYVEPDPAQIEAELPQLGAPRPRTRRRRASQPGTIITSRTDVLDAWYAFELGGRETAASKPTMRCNAQVGKHLDVLADGAGPGWLAMGATLLDGDTATQRGFGRYGPDMAAKTRSDGRSHTITLTGGTRAALSFVLVWATFDPTRPAQRERVRMGEYLAAKKHQTGVSRGFCMVFDDAGELAATFYDNRIPGPDADLDRQTPFLRPVDTATTMYRPKRRSGGRVTPKKRR